MSTSPPPPPQDPQDLQFDHADFTVASGPAAAASSCTACQQPITDTYYEVSGRIFCPRCKDAIQKQLTGGSGTGRLLRALIFGVVTALVGSALYYGVRKLTGWEIGLVAVLLGWMVGSAVRRGAHMRGGIAYQLLAVLLTYASISYSYLPDVIEGARDKREAKAEKVEKRDAKTPGANRSSATAIADSEKSVTSETSPPISAKVEGAEDSTGSTQSTGAEIGTKLKEMSPVVRFIVGSLLLLMFPLMLPILVAKSSPISGLIYIFGLWQAWNMNKRPHVVITGPYNLRAGVTPASAPPPLSQ